MFAVLLAFIGLCDTLRETNIGQIYSTLMSPGRRRWRGRPVLGARAHLPA